jgi:Acetyltransferase (GNAT) domain
VKDAFLFAGRAETDWSWFVTMAQSVLGSGEELVIAALLDQQGLCRSALPLVRRGESLRAATSCYTTEFAPPFQDEKSAFLLGKGLARKCRELRFDAVPEGYSPLAAFLAGLSSAGFATETYRHFANWHEEISGFPEYWNERSTRLKSLIQRKGRRLESAKRLAFERVDLRADLDRGVALYEAIYAKSWKEPETHERFMEILMKNLGAAGLAQLGIVRIDGSPAAAQVWLVRAPRATIFKLAHDPAFDQHSPGSLLTHWMLKQFCELDGVRSFDFGRGNDDYKRLWLKNCRFRCGAVAVDPRSLRGAWRYITEIVPTRVAHLGLATKLRRRLKYRARQKCDFLGGQET